MQVVPFARQYARQLEDLLKAMQGYLSHLDSTSASSVSPSFGQEKLGSLLKDQVEAGRKIFLAVEEEQVLGYIIGRIEQGEKKIGRVEELYIDALARGKGLGTMLVKTLRAYFQKEQCVSINVAVHPQNTPAAALYLKLGFTRNEEDLVYQLVAE